MAATLEEVVAKLREIPCPRCLNLGGLAMMRCGPGRGECDYLASCGNCGYVFEVEVAAVALERLERESHVRERVDPCLSCGAHDIEIHFACDTKKHTCFFVATCRACGRTFRIPVRP